MGIIQYDGIIFADVQDLIAYKQAMGHKQEQPEKGTYWNDHELTGHRQPYVPQQKVVVVQKKQKHQLVIENYHAEIEDFYRKHFRKEKIKINKIAKLAKRIGFSKHTIGNYASLHGIVQKITQERAVAKAAKPMTQAKPIIQKTRGTAYTKSEEQLIMGDMPIAEIAKQLGRTIKAIEQRRYRLFNKHPTLKNRYMLRNKPVKPLSYEEAMIKKARGDSAPEGGLRAITAFPLTKESIEVLKTLLQDAAQRHNIISFGMAKSNLSLVDGRDFTLDVWQDITQQILKQSEAIRQQWGVKVFSQGMQGSIKAE